MTLSQCCFNMKMSYFWMQKEKRKNSFKFKFHNTLNSYVFFMASAHASNNCIFIKNLIKYFLLFDLRQLKLQMDMRQTLQWYQYPMPYQLQMKPPSSKQKKRHEFASVSSLALLVFPYCYVKPAITANG